MVRARNFVHAIGSGEKQNCLAAAARQGQDGGSRGKERPVTLALVRHACVNGETPDRACHSAPSFSHINLLGEGA
jgi:hypothetical protein